mmetsp:Transcript_22791/g.44387  ORF Transcript_22791/g.44387 Transcript_22791/m.44387 type:complete len:217 (+) Transcript_22791:486-1136(+)
MCRCVHLYTCTCAHVHTCTCTGVQGRYAGANSRWSTASPPYSGMKTSANPLPSTSPAEIPPISPPKSPRDCFENPHESPLFWDGIRTNASFSLSPLSMMYGLSPGSIRFPRGYIGTAPPGAAIPGSRDLAENPEASTCFLSGLWVRGSSPGRHSKAYRAPLRFLWEVARRSSCPSPFTSAQTHPNMGPSLSSMTFLVSSRWGEPGFFSEKMVIFWE